MRALDLLLRDLHGARVKLWREGDSLRFQAPRGALTPALRAELTERKAEILALLHEQVSLPQLVPAPEQRFDPFPLTDVQAAYLLGRGDHFALGGVSTHAYFEIDTTGLDLERLNRAWQRLIERHEMLRAVIRSDGQQQILPHPPLYQIALLDLSQEAPATVEAELDRLRERMSHQVLPADQWPLFEVRATRLSPTMVRLHISFDLLIVDGWSMQVLFRESNTLYRDPNATLPALTISFRDYLLALSAFAQTAVYQQSLAYWRQRLDSLPLGPKLPLAQDPGRIQRLRFRRREGQLAAPVWAALKARAQQASLTPSGLLLAAYAEILANWSREIHFTLNLTLFNRYPIHPQVAEMVGDSTQLIMLEVNREESASFLQRAQGVQRQLWNDLEQSHVSGVWVLRELARHRGAEAHGRLMPVVFTSMLGVANLQAVREQLGEIVYAITQTPQIWLDHQVMEENGALIFYWDGVEELFPPGLLDAMFAAYCALLHRLTEEDAVWQAPQLSLTPAPQLVQRAAVNGTQAPLSDDMLHTLFLKQAARQPDQIAVIAGEQTLTYGELQRRANQIGHWLRDRGATPNSLVAVVMHKGWEQVVAVLGIHLAGAAYLPVDPDLPAERRSYLLEQGEVRLALTQSGLAAELNWPESIESLGVDALLPEADLPLLVSCQQPTDLAYVIYTSGSTGQPKGVVIDHRGAVNTVLDINRRFGVTDRDRVLALSALNFDLSVYDIFGLLAAGGAIVLPDPARRIDPAHWLELMAQHLITVWNTVPALMQMLVDYGDDKVIPEHPLALVPCHLVMLSGDWIPLTLPDRIRAIWPEAQLISLGGATEASIWSNFYPIQTVEPGWSSIPYGWPLTNQSLHVLDAQLNPRPVWVPGDLYIGGVGLALGYWRDEERTQASFIEHPQMGERLYKTGDLGRYLPDGTIEFLGRGDFQVKIRGHRIELGEIEAALVQLPGVREAVVSAVGDPKGTRQLVAYVVLDDPTQDDHLTSLTPQLAEVDSSLAQEKLILDSVERLTFRFGQPGLRKFSAELDPGVALPKPDMDPSRRAAYLLRQSYRHFLDDPIPLADFSHFLSCLMQMPVAGAPLPKYRYASAGSLYPVQTYLHVRSGRIEDLESGFYYYHPALHRLTLLSRDDDFMGKLNPEANAPIFERAAFSLFLVAQMEAIQPMYGPMARRFSWLEAGYMSQLLMTEAPNYQMGLCPIGAVDLTVQELLERAMDLQDGHELVHSLMGGRIDPAQSTVWMQRVDKADPSTWQRVLQEGLAQKLPSYMLPTHYVALSALPLTANGKVDRSGLPAPEATVVSTQGYAPPRTGLEEELAAIWAELLRVERVGIHDNFFDLGGDSLVAVQILARLESAGFSLSLTHLFEVQTIAGIAPLIEQHV